jgi:hypothetical protein
MKEHFPIQVLMEFAACSREVEMAFGAIMHQEGSILTIADTSVSSPCPFEIITPATLTIGVQQNKVEGRVHCVHVVEELVS